METKIKKELLSELVLFVFAVFTIILFKGHNLMVIVLLIIGTAISFGLTKIYGQRFAFLQSGIILGSIMIFVVAGICGPIAEIIAIHYGIWQYAHPDFLGIPIWLFPLWGYASVFLNRFSNTLLYFYDKWNKAKKKKRKKK